MCDGKFEVGVHHGGEFEENGAFACTGGEISNWSCGLDRWSYFGVLGVVRDIGYVAIMQLWYYVEKMLLLMKDDNGVINMVNVAKHYGEVLLYVVHGSSEAEQSPCGFQLW